MKALTQEQLDKMTEWAQTATLTQLLIELTKVSSMDRFEGFNSEASSMLQKTIVTRFDK